MRNAAIVVPCNIKLGIKSLLGMMEGVVLLAREALIHDSYGPITILHSVPSNKTLGRNVKVPA
jgi:hypothetical protein